MQEMYGNIKYFWGRRTLFTVCAWLLKLNIIYHFSTGVKHNTIWGRMQNVGLVISFHCPSTVLLSCGSVVLMNCCCGPDELGFCGPVLGVLWCWRTRSLWPSAGHDVPAAPGTGLPPLAPRGPPRPEAPEHPSHQWRTDQTGRLRPGAHLQLPDGPHLCGELWQAGPPV